MIREEGAAVVGALAGSRPRVAGKRHPRSVHRDALVSEDCRNFGAAEMWYLKMPPSLTGTAAKPIFLLPDKRGEDDYIAGSPHGGGPGGFSVTPLALPNGSGTNWGACALPANLMPYTQTSNACRAVPELGDARHADASEPLPEVARPHRF